MWASNMEHSMDEKNKTLQYFVYTIFQFVSFKFCNKYISQKLFGNIRFRHDRPLHTKIHRPSKRGPTSPMTLIF